MDEEKEREEMVTSARVFVAEQLFLKAKTIKDISPHKDAGPYILMELPMVEMAVEALKKIYERN